MSPKTLIPLLTLVKTKKGKSADQETFYVLSSAGVPCVAALCCMKLAAVQRKSDGESARLFCLVEADSSNINFLVNS